MMYGYESTLSSEKQSREHRLQIGRKTRHNVLDVRPQFNGNVIRQRQMTGLQERLSTNSHMAAAFIGTD